MTATTSDQERDPGSLGARLDRYLENRPGSLLLPLKNGPAAAADQAAISLDLLQRILPEAEGPVPPEPPDRAAGTDGC
jgi:hypothetical protein